MPVVNAQRSVLGLIGKICYGYINKNNNLKKLASNSQPARIYTVKAPVSFLGSNKNG